MKACKHVAALAAVLVASGGLTAWGKDRTTRSVPLFDGHSLVGWHAVMIAANGTAIPAVALFRVEGGAIHVYPGAADGSMQPHAILETDRAYKAYRLHLEYRWGTARFAARTGPRDAGVLTNIVPERPGLVETWYRWPPSLEYQIMQGDTGSAYLLKARGQGAVDPQGGGYIAPEQGGVPRWARLQGRDYSSYKLTRAAAAAERPGWNSVDIEVRGDAARFFLNGVPVNAVSALVEDRSGPPVAMRRGRIALQAESAEVWYRAVTIEPLDDGDGSQP